MTASGRLKFVGFIPPESLEKVRAAVFAAGAGRIGDYTECSWSTLGTGTFRPGAGSDPAVGERGVFETVEELRFETVCDSDNVDVVCSAFVDAHPYEEPAFEVYPLRPSPEAREALTGADSPADDGELMLDVGAPSGDPAHFGPPAQLWFDGGSRGNPGPAAIGYVILDHDGSEIERHGHVIGEATNNIAEYRALVSGLRRALDLGAQSLRIHSDSELVVKQIGGTYKVKHAGLKPHFEEARELLDRLASYSIDHVPRVDNAIADELVNDALDAQD